MLLLIGFAFLGGLVTILSPCILPILPIILSGSLTGGKQRPLGIITGFVLSFTVFTLTLTTIVRATNLPSDTLRFVAVAVVFLFGLSLLIPQTQVLLEKLFSSVSRFMPKGGNADSGFMSGILVGLSLGLVWTPCVGPILASIITLASTSQVTFAAFAITLSYSLGTALPMLFITYTGRALLTKVPWLLQNSAKIQQGFGVIMIATAVAIYFNVDRQFQAYILDRFPEYGAGLTAIEDNAAVQKQLDKLQEDVTGSSNSLLDNVQDTLDGLKDYGEAPEITGGQTWINSEPLTMEGLRGKVVLVDFWTYSCINCIRTLPYLTQWHEKYADEGLVIVGVHAPEFEFEKKLENVEEAVADFEIEYPVVQDNDFEIWRNYNNRYWPAKYLVDAEGRVRYVHFGEGAYEETEKHIRQLLEDANGSISDIEMVEVQEFRSQTRTPETYLGYSRAKGFASNQRPSLDDTASYSYPQNLRLNQWALAGDWLITEEYSKPEAGGSLQIQFQAKQVNLVMAPTAENVKVEVFLDGEPITNPEKGRDVGTSVVTLDKERLYSLVDLDEPGEHTLELRFPDGNAESYAFTFG
jgi:cytochrome c biogenesis protein CcdA/thiol-disulfide isomerase/thioredoxin